MSTTSVTGCGAPDQGAPIPAGVDVEKETVITGFVRTDVGEPIPGAYVRLLDGSGEFTAEVVTSSAGQFRFFAAPGSWTLRTLAPKADPVDRQVVAQYGEVAEVAVTV